MFKIFQKELKLKSNQIYNNLNMLNLPDLQVDTATISNINIETNDDDPTTSSSNKIDSNNFINSEEITPEMMSMMMKNKLNGMDTNNQSTKSLFNDSEDVIFITND